jgi:hypothetical protein
MGSSPELATRKSTVTPNTCPMIMYLNNISVNPEFENISLMNLLNTDEMSFSLVHKSTLLEYEENNDEIDDMTNIFDTLATQQSSLSKYSNYNEAEIHRPGPVFWP